MADDRQWQRQQQRAHRSDILEFNDWVWKRTIFGNRMQFGTNWQRKTSGRIKCSYSAWPRPKYIFLAVRFGLVWLVRFVFVFVFVPHLFFCFLCAYFAVDSAFISCAWAFLWCRVHVRFHFYLVFIRTVQLYSRFFSMQFNRRHHRRRRHLRHRRPHRHRCFCCFRILIIFLVCCCFFKVF